MSDASGVRVDVANKEDIRSSAAAYGYGGSIGDFSIGMSSTAIAKMADSKMMTVVIVAVAVIAVVVLIKKGGA